MLSLNAVLGDLFRRGVFYIGALALLRLINDDALKLFLFVKEIRNVEKGIAFESDIDKSRLHSRQHAHDAALVDVANDPLMGLAAFDVEFANLLVFDDRYFLFASIDADDQFFCHIEILVSWRPPGEALIAAFSGQADCARRSGTALSDSLVILGFVGLGRRSGQCQEAWPTTP